MGIKEALAGVVQTAGNAYAFFIEKGHKLRNNPEFFEKVGLVAIAALQLLGNYIQALASMTRLTFALGTVLMHDFYNFLKQPRAWLFPISVDLIDEYSVLVSLDGVLQKQLDPTLSNVSGIEKLSEDSLKKRLGAMASGNDAYRSIEEFKEVLQKQIRATTGTPFDAAIQTVDLKDLNVVLRHVPLLERINTCFWHLADLTLVLYFFNQWKLIDLGSWAEKVGQYPGFQWVKHSSLETWSLGILCGAFGIKLVEATRKLFDDFLTEEERVNARWNVASATADLIYFGAMYLNQIGQSTIPKPVISGLGIIARSIGLVKIAMKPDHVYFQPQLAPAAA